MKIFQFLLFNLFLVSTISCTNNDLSDKDTSENKDKKLKQVNKELVKQAIHKIDTITIFKDVDSESLKVFLNNFFSDSLFQMQHILLPMYNNSMGIETIPMEFDTASWHSIDIWTAKNWRFRSFSGTLNSILVSKNATVAKHETETDLFFQLYIPQTGIFYVCHFKKIEQKWYLIYDQYMAA